MSVRLFYPEPLAGIAIHTVFEYRHPLADKGGGLFRDVEYTFFEEAETKNQEEADAIVLVNNFFKPLDAQGEEYLKHHADEAEKVGKPLFIFSCGDFTDALTFDKRMWVFKMSVYRSAMGERDIVIPTTTEDPPAGLIFERPKEAKPLVAFCGMGGFPSWKAWLKYYAKLLIWDVRALIQPQLRARKIGVYWRRAMMRACEHSPLVRTNFIVRNSFSAHAESIELDPARARQEYLETTANADFVLAPKGDGNYSNRFIKTLAFGRIPVLVDTDVVLPLEGVLPYEKIIVRIPMQSVTKTPRYIAEFYGGLNEEEWKARQKLARDIFQTELKQDVFFRNFFSRRFSGNQ